MLHLRCTWSYAVGERGGDAGCRGVPILLNQDTVVGVVARYVRNLGGRGIEVQRYRGTEVQRYCVDKDKHIRENLFLLHANNDGLLLLAHDGDHHPVPEFGVCTVGLLAVLAAVHVEYLGKQMSHRTFGCVCGCTTRTCGLSEKHTLHWWLSCLEEWCS